MCSQAHTKNPRVPGTGQLQIETRLGPEMRQKPLTGTCWIDDLMSPLAGLHPIFRWAGAVASNDVIVAAAVAATVVAVASFVAAEIA